MPIPTALRFRSLLQTPPEGSDKDRFAKPVGMTFTKGVGPAVSQRSSAYLTGAVHCVVEAGQQTPTCCGNCLSLLEGINEDENIVRSDSKSDKDDEDEHHVHVANLYTTHM